MVKSTAQASMSELPEFPCIMRSTDFDSNLLVLFTGEGVGTVLVADKFYSIGAHHSGWGMEFFKPYRGSVTLES